MINTFQESMMSVDEAAAHVARLTGTKKNRPQILRWMRKGAWGVRLDSISTGTERHTSKEALDRFLNDSGENRSKKSRQQRSPKLNAELEARAELLGI